MNWLLFFLFFLCSTNSNGRVLYSFADVAEKSIPGVVNIRTKTYVRKDPALDLYQFFLNGRVPQGQTTTSLGSGLVIDQAGILLTNYHVIKDADKIEVLFAKNKYITQAKILGIDRKTDLALLQINSKYPLVPLQFGDSNSLRIGDVVLAIGNPFGYAHTVTGGIISAKGRVIGTGPYDDFLQTDAIIHPGNSGGPLIDARGRVIGINTAVSQQGTGIGFAIPINLAKQIIRDLQKFGKVIRPWLGIVGKNILSNEDIEQSADQNGVYGVLVANLIVDGPAHSKGVKIGDLLMSIDEVKIHDLNELQRILTEKEPGNSIVLKIYRRGVGFLTLNVPLSEIPKSRDLPQEEDLF